MSSQKVNAKQLFKRALFHCSPRLYEGLFLSQQSRHGRGDRDTNSLTRIGEALVERYGSQVQSGPFRGLSYLPYATGSALLPKLVGSYEDHLHEVFATVLQNKYDVVVDVGCAEGYYVVCLLYTSPSPRD